MAERESLSEAVVRAAGLLRAIRKPCAFVGGAAVVARVRARLTEDVDAFVTYGPTDIDDILRLAREHGYSFSDRDSDDFREVGLIRLWGPPGQKQGRVFDLMLADNDFLRGAVTRASPMQAFGISMNVAQPEDLMLMKLEADRPGDMEDAISIKDVFGTKLDLTYLRSNADKLGPAVRRRLDLLLPP